MAADAGRTFSVAPSTASLASLAEPREILGIDADRLPETLASMDRPDLEALTAWLFQRVRWCPRCSASALAHAASLPDVPVLAPSPGFTHKRRPSSPSSGSESDESGGPRRGGVFNRTAMLSAALPIIGERKTPCALPAASGPTEHRRSLSPVLPHPSLLAPRVVDAAPAVARRDLNPPPVLTRARTPPPYSRGLVPAPPRKARLSDDIPHTTFVGRTSPAKPQVTDEQLPLRGMVFYQDYVCNSFSDGRPLCRTIEELRCGAATPETIEALQAIRTTDGKVFCMTNRRFACYNIVFGPDRVVPVRVTSGVDPSNVLPQGSGTTVAVGGGLLLDGKVRFTIVLPR